MLPRPASVARVSPRVRKASASPNSTVSWQPAIGCTPSLANFSEISSAPNRLLMSVTATAGMSSAMRQLEQLADRNRALAQGKARYGRARWTKPTFGDRLFDHSLLPLSVISSLTGVSLSVTRVAPPASGNGPLALVRPRFRRIPHNIRVNATFYVLVMSVLFRARFFAKYFLRRNKFVVKSIA